MTFGTYIHVRYYTPYGITKNIDKKAHPFFEYLFTNYKALNIISPVVFEITNAVTEIVLMIIKEIYPKFWYTFRC